MYLKCRLLKSTDAYTYLITLLKKIDIETNNVDPNQTNRSSLIWVHIVKDAFQIISADDKSEDNSLSLALYGSGCCPLQRRW